MDKSKKIQQIYRSFWVIGMALMGLGLWTDNSIIVIVALVLLMLALVKLYLFKKSKGESVNFWLPLVSGIVVLIAFGLLYYLGIL